MASNINTARVEEADYSEKRNANERSRLLNSDSDDSQVVIQPVVVAESNVSNTGSLMHLIKGNVGTGILAMPSALHYAGLWVGFIGLGCIGLIATHCMHLLIQASRRLCARIVAEGEEPDAVVRLDYGQVAEKAVYYKSGSEKYGRAAKVTVNVFICITQFGFCTVYVLFVAEHLQQVIEHFSHVDLPKQAYMAIVLALLIPYSFVKNLKLLSPFSSFANILTFAGLFIILAYCFTDMPSYKLYPAFNSWRTLPLYFGIAIYAFEGIAVVLPVENRMRTPSAFYGLSGVLNTSMVIVTVMYMSVGFFGYIKFGNDVKGSITLSLPPTGLYLAVKLVFAVAIFISYGLQFYVPAFTVFPVITNAFAGSINPTYSDAIVRISAVIFTFLLAASIPQLDLMISLVGALASSALALIFPPAIELLTLPTESLGVCKWKVVKDIAIMAFGLIGFFTGTVTTVMQIIDSFNK